MSHRSTLTIVAVMAIAMGVLTGCGSSSKESTATSKKKADATVSLEVGEMFIKPATSTVASGNVKFAVKNAGSMTHEVVVLKTTTPADKLPVAKNRVSEADSVGEVGDIAAGTTKSSIIKLAPGTYVLVCNIPGHYAAGMRASLTVT